MRMIIGIAGPSAGGKTTVTNKICENFLSEEVSVISFDDYYKDQSALSMEQRYKTNYDHPDAFDVDMLIKHIEKLKNGEKITKPIYDFVKHNRSDVTEQISSTKVIIVEGLFSLLEKKLFDLFDIKIYVETDSDICFIRRLKRDMDERSRSLDSVVNQYLTTVKPMQTQFIEPTRKNAHIIIPNGGENVEAIELVRKTISDYINE